MILTGKQIHLCYESGVIVIDPYSAEQINPNSYDFLLGKTLLRYTSPVLDPRKNNDFELFEIPENGFVIEKGCFYLGHTDEVLGSVEYVPIIHGKSSTARLGLFVHITADLIDIGSVNQFTLQLYAAHSIRVYPRMRIGQVTFWKPAGEISIYQGKYQGSRGPVSSKSHLDG